MCVCVCVAKARQEATCRLNKMNLISPVCLLNLARCLHLWVEAFFGVQSCILAKTLQINKNNSIRNQETCSVLGKREVPPKSLTENQQHPSCMRGLLLSCRQIPAWTCGCTFTAWAGFETLKTYEYLFRLGCLKMALNVKKDRLFKVEQKDNSNNLLNKKVVSLRREQYELSPLSDDNCSWMSLVNH